MKGLRLVRAPRLDADRSITRFRKFLDDHPNPFVTARGDDVIHSAIDDESFFFVEDENGEIVATTGFYRHGHDEDDQWGEIGSTLVDEAYRGMQLQVVIYRHLIAFKKLADWPPHVIAVVDERARSSYSNIERCGFHRQARVPSELITATSLRRWDPVISRKKRLYCLTPAGVAESLDFVAARGQANVLVDRDGLQRYLLHVDFDYLAEPDASEALRSTARDILKNPTEIEMNLCLC